MDDYLMHHGIRGMKWGRRLYQYSDGRLTPLGKLRYRKGSGKRRSTNKKQQKKDAIKKSKNANEYRQLLTDAELDRRIKRLEKEKRLRELSYSELTPGKKKAHELIDRYGNQAASIAVGAIAGYMVRDVLLGGKGSHSGDK